MRNWKPLFLVAFLAVGLVLVACGDTGGNSTANASGTSTPADAASGTAAATGDAGVIGDPTADCPGCKKDGKCSGDCKDGKCSGDCKSGKCSGDCKSDKCSGNCKSGKCSGDCKDGKCSGNCKDGKCSGNCKKTADVSGAATACVCDKGKAGEAVWCAKCQKGYVDGKPVCCENCVKKALAKVNTKN